MGPGLVIWEGTWSEILNGCESGAQDGGFLGDFQLDLDTGMWEGFWSEIPDGPLAFSGGTWWGNLVVEPGNFCHSRGHALCECCHPTLKGDEKVI